MCVIIEKFADKEVPYENIKSACEVNSHGWGAVIHDRGKLEVIREYDEKGNDPDRVARFLEQAKDVKAVAHMRIQTAGARDKFNCHPFDVLDLTKEGVDIKFFHNGTMSQFVDPKSSFSDTFWFNSSILKPLMSRWAQTGEPDAVLKSPVLRSILSQYAGTQSVFTLIDSFGNIMHINKDRGEEYDWGWASNRYSFRNIGSKKTHTNYIAKGGSLVPFVPTQQKPATSTCIVPSMYQQDNTLGKPAEKVATKIQDNQERFPIAITKADDTVVNIEKPYLASPKDRASFKELLNLQSLRELCWLEDSELVEFCCLFPDLMALLVMDLLWELFQLNPKAA